MTDEQMAVWCENATANLPGLGDGDKVVFRKIALRLRLLTAHPDRNAALDGIAGQEFVREMFSRSEQTRACAGSIRRMKRHFEVRGSK